MIAAQVWWLEPWTHHVYVAYLNNKSIFSEKDNESCDCWHKHTSYMECVMIVTQGFYCGP